MMAGDPVGRSEDVIEELAPDLADVYDIDLEIPEIKGTMAGYASMGVAMEYRPPREDMDSDPGTVKVREDSSWPQTSLAATVGHELGHAALYQNSDFGEMRDDDSYDDRVLRAMSEGIAQHFERTAYRSLGKQALQQYDVSGAVRYTFRYTIKRGGQRVWDATVGRRYPDVYSEGRDLMTGMSKEDVHDILTDPEEYYHEIVDGF